MEDKNLEKREKAFDYGMPILGGIVMGMGLILITKVWWHFFVGFICGAYIFIRKNRLKKKTSNSTTASKNPTHN